MKKRKKMKPVTAWACFSAEHMLTVDHECWWPPLAVFDTKEGAEADLDPHNNERVVRVRITEAPKKRRSKKP